MRGEGGQTEEATDRGDRIGKGQTTEEGVIAGEETRDRKIWLCNGDGGRRGDKSVILSII